MKESNITRLATEGVFKGKTLSGDVEETHISWVILSGKYAFKIKKPLKLPFLDFSTLALRKKYCKREVTLNSRFSNIYHGVQPIRDNGNHLTIGGTAGEIIDYAVQMKRMDSARRMDNLLKTRKVGVKDISSLAAGIAAFHKRAIRVCKPFDMRLAKKTYNDITIIRHFVKDQLGNVFLKILDRSVSRSDAFLQAHSDRIVERIDGGLIRDVHGDLHSGNIFLYRKPVLFDCIEFNDQYRQIDVLYEIAFLCMDLEAFGYDRLAEVLLSSYNKRFRCIEVREDKDLFIYFKALRANVRAKVHAMSAMQESTVMEVKHHVKEIRKYLLLIDRYFKR